VAVTAISHHPNSALLSTLDASLSLGPVPKDLGFLLVCGSFSPASASAPSHC
jgi:hypothetical protein